MNLKQWSIKVWVLAPHLETTDSNLNYYYDYTQSIAEYTKVFATLQLPWQWQPVTMANFTTIIDAIAANTTNDQPIILNLCDGDEVNGAPGISVIHYLEKKQLCYTGADAFFYAITTSKIPMKQAFDAACVPTPAWVAMHDAASIQATTIFETLGSPIIVKPAISGGSMGVGIKNVVHEANALQMLVQQMFTGYRGWNLTADGVMAEAFVKGREFTVFLVGSYMHPEKAIIYMPVERVFHPSLPDTEQFLSYDRLWEFYEDETPMPNNDYFYEYACPEPALHQPLQQLAWKAFEACKGIGYTRVDIRMDQASEQLMVLEVNAQCGLSEDEDYTSIGAILKASKISFAQTIEAILVETLQRKDAFLLLHSST